MDRLTDSRPLDQVPDTTPLRMPVVVRRESSKWVPPSQTGRFFFNNHLYFSRSEAACGALMERYVPGFKIRDGETFQVPIGVNRFQRMRHVDFLVRNVLVEFHQPRFWRSKERHGDFESPQQFREYKQALQALPSDQREAFRELTKVKLGLQYTLKREAQVALSLDHAGKELIVASDARDFYHKVIVRFGRHVPEERDFLHQFSQICARAKELDPDSERPGRRSRKRGR